MALGIRGINPIWYEVDLTGHAFDDNFYLYVLQNTIPYIPAIIYADVDLSIPLTNPVQFLANGTLPIDIFYDPTQVYRLEFRQNNGIDPPSQSDPLIYEVNNYVPGSGGSTPVTTVAFPTGNQVTNPQFALFNLESPTTITVAGTYNIAPGWFLDLVGTGSATITQVPLTSVNPTVSNAPYALHLVLSGWNADSVVLRQRFHQSGVLWSNMAVACAITAATGSGFSTLTANLVNDLGMTLANVLSVPVVNTTLTEYTGLGVLGVSTDTTQPPSAYIELQIPLSSSADINLTSIQLVVESPSMPFQPSFIQDSVDRQINGTYHDAYPIVPVGTVIDFAGFVVPTHYLPCDGSLSGASAPNRIKFNLLFQVLTFLDTVTWTSTTTFTVASSANYRVGMKIEGPGIPASTSITIISGTTITISNFSSSTGMTQVRFFAVGNGDGSTTFNIPDLRDFVTAGLGGSLFAPNGNGVGGAGGASTHTIGLNEIPQHTHNPLSPATGIYQEGAGSSVTGLGSILSLGTTGGITGYSAQTALSLVQLTALMKKCIRYQ